MKACGYSLVEVVVAAAVVAIGVAAAAAMMNALVAQEETNAGAIRAANLHEQATMLYRLGLTNADVQYSILPEQCSASPEPLAGNFSLTFAAPVVVTNNATLSGGGSTEVVYEATTSTMVFANPGLPGSPPVNLTNTHTIVRPRIRVGP